MANIVTFSGAPKAFVIAFLKRAKAARSVQYAETILHPTQGLFREMKSRVDAKHQRNIKGRIVARYAADLVEGHWELTSLPYVFAINGRLLDGQHRVEACVIAGKAPPEIVMTATKDPDAYRAVDIGSPRSAADMYKDRVGEALGGSAHSGIVYETLDFKFIIRQSPRRADGQVERYDQLDLLDTLPRKLVAGLFAAALRASRVDRELAGLFFTALANGSQSLVDGGPALSTLRVLQHAITHGAIPRTGDQNKQAAAFLALSAFKAFYEGRHIKRLQSPKGGFGAGVVMPITKAYVAYERKHGNPRRKVSPLVRIVSVKA